MPKTRLNRYFLIIRITRIMISIVLAGLIIGVVVICYNFFDKKHKTRDKPRVISIIKDAQHAAQNLSFYGRDSNKQPYNILAKQAFQNPDKIVELNQVNVNYNFKDDQVITMFSDVAYLNTEHNTLKLNGNVDINFDNKYSLVAQNVQINYKEMIAEGNSDVELISGIGKIKSHQFIIKDDYVKFFGNRVNTTLYPNITNPK